MTNHREPDLSGGRLIGGAPRKGAPQPVALVRSLDERGHFDLTPSGEVPVETYISAEDLVAAIVVGVAQLSEAPSAILDLVDAVRARRTLDEESAAAMQEHGVDPVELAAYLESAREINERIDVGLRAFELLEAARLDASDAALRVAQRAQQDGA